MRFNAAVAGAVYSSALLLGSVSAQDAVPESSETESVVKPAFTVSGYFIRKTSELVNSDLRM